MSKFTPAQATAAIVVSYYWHFVDIVWIALFADDLLHPIDREGVRCSRQMGRTTRKTDDKSRRRLRRRLTGAVLLLVGLAVAGGLAATLTPTPQVAVADESQSALLRTGKQLYETACITCHGANLQGVAGRGPSLIGVGEAAVYFQVSTGRMPAMRGEAQAPRKAPIFDEAQIDALGAYVQANGGGPLAPRDANGADRRRSR